MNWHLADLNTRVCALIDKKGCFRSRADDTGQNPIIYYRGAIIASEGTNEQGETQQITALIQDINKLINE